MTEEEKAASKAAIESLPFENQLGFDVPRTWATGVQVFANPGHFLIVFREVVTQVAGDETTLHARNVSSIIMPLEVAEDMHRILGQVLPSVGKDGKD